MRRERVSALLAVGMTMTFLVLTVNAESYSFQLTPASGAVGGPPGSMVGWGYEISNESASDWLVTTTLNSDSFLYSTPNLLFDFPAIAPGATVRLPYNAKQGLGLYELVWDSSAPVGFQNSGMFTLSAQWWTGDPLDDGTLIMEAQDESQPYQAVVEPEQPIPESSTLILLIGGLNALVLWKRVKH